MNLRHLFIPNKVEEEKTEEKKNESKPSDSSETNGSSHLDEKTEKEIEEVPKDMTLDEVIIDWYAKRKDFADSNSQEDDQSPSFSPKELSDRLSDIFQGQSQGEENEQDPDSPKISNEGILEVLTLDSKILKHLFAKRKPERNGVHSNSNNEIKEDYKDWFEEEDKNQDLKLKEEDDPVEEDPFEDKDDSGKGDFKDNLKRLLMAHSTKEDEGEDEDNDKKLYDENNDQTNGLEEEFKNFNEAKEAKEEEKGPFMVISNDSLSYERFYPGRILGNTFHVSNKSKHKITLKLSFTTNNLDKDYAKQRLMDFYETSKLEEVEQPYRGLLDTDFVDAQKEFDCWFIEDPKTKSLVKETTLELDADEYYEFIIVLKSPVIKKPHFLLTNVKVENIVDGEEHLVFAFGSLDFPRLICPKEIQDKENGFGSVKVVMRKKMAVQPFRFLLVNKGEMPVSVNFSSLESDEMLSFFVKTPNMYIEAGSRAILEVKASHKYKNVPDNKWKPMNSLKLLIGKIKD